MLHSIILAHRNRQQRLALCLRSIHLSAARSHRKNYEVIVVDGGSDPPVFDEPYVRVVNVALPDENFNKCLLLNRGIEEAKGDLLTFLDADAIVGSSWLVGAETLLDNPTLTRLCYRVKILEQKWLDKLSEAAAKNSFDVGVDYVFARFDSPEHRRAHEGYGKPELNWGVPDDNADPKRIFGNSQFSIRRDVLGDLRCDEVHYPKRGFEDLAFIRDIADHYGDRYRGRLVRKPERAMFHIENASEPEWYDQASNFAQQQYYVKTEKKRS